MPRQHIENIDIYMNEIKELDRITTQEEIELANKMRTGTPEERLAARDRLVCTNLKLVVKIAHDFKHYDLSFGDIVSEGNLGLITAAEKFDPSKGVRFSCYASWWIKQAIRKAILWQTRVIRIPGGTAQKMVQLHKAKQRFMTEYGREPTNEELVACSNIGLSTIMLLSKAATETYSMNATVSEDSTTTFEAALAEKADDTAEKAARVSVVHDALDKLTPLERTVITYAYGIGREKMDSKTICQETGLSFKALEMRLTEIMDKLKDIIGAPESLFV